MELLLELSTIAGAGVIASFLLDDLRNRIPATSFFGKLIYTPRYARYFSLVLAASLASAAAYAAQSLGGPSADYAVATAWGVVFSQATHAIRHLSTTPSVGEGQ
jgi:hypothetical protein